MKSRWSFGQKLGFALGACALLTVGLATVAVLSLRAVIDSKERVITVNAHALIQAQSVAAALQEKVAVARGYLLVRDDSELERLGEVRNEFAAYLSSLRRLAAGEEELRLLRDIEVAESDHQEALDHVLEMRRGQASLEEIAKRFDESMSPRGEQLARTLAAFTDFESNLLERAQHASSVKASSVMNLVFAVSIVGGVAMVLAAFLLTRALSRSVGAAVGQVQSSSSELQAAASQQASGAKQQATAMGDITTTISELLASSQQIAESAQRVAHIASDTARAANDGQGTVEKARDSIASIRKQVDLIVERMLDLGKKSQEIGSVLEIVAELSEQTNILAINATIEAAGSGESGLRFAAVAEEIRKLADRVGGSTKEIRSLIEDVRMAVNSTVMATESGSKAVDAGARESSEVTSAFGRIATLVSTTTEAAREIELSTKQQASAVEQVTSAISSVAQASRETETSSSQTLQTASQLKTMAMDLLRLIQSSAPSRA
jgi:methyl-accepting chemotaxis protein